MIRVRFFGRFSDLVEDPQGLLLDAANMASVADVIAWIASEDEVLHREITGPQVMVAVNQQVVGPGAPLADGDEVAFLPPVTGG